jgi:hypothetical protein
MMVTLTCPWCESDVAFDPRSDEPELRCPECATSCLLEDAPRQLELAPAA